MSTILLLDACKNNSLETVQNILNTNLEIDIESCNDNTFIEICKYSNYEIITWILNNFPNINFSYNNWKCFKISWNHNRDLCKYIIDNYWSPLTAFEWACINSYIDIGQWIYNNYNLDEKIYSDLYIYCIYLDCTKKGFNDIIFFLLDKFGINNKDRLDILLVSLKHNHIKTADIIFKHKDIDLTLYDNWLFYQICKSCSYNSLKWLYKKNPKIKNINNIDFAILQTCSGNNVDIIKWIIDTFDFDFNKNLGNYIKYSIENDAYLVFEYLYDKSKPIIDNSIFYSICEYGSVNIAQFIFKKKIIDTNKTNIIENGFLKAGLNEHNNILNFLLSINNNINIGLVDNKVFKLACKNNNINIASLFKNRYPNIYSFIVDNGDIVHYSIKQDIKCIGEIKPAEILKCSICIHKDSEIITDCNHQYCNECINNWFLIKENCPYCRKNNIKFYKIIRDL